MSSSSCKHQPKKLNGALRALKRKPTREQRLADEELGKDVEHVLEARRVHFEVVNRLLRRRRRVAPSVVQRDHLLVVRLGWILF
jgi:hypothetical protein